jgi:hypothetical protein
MWRELVKDYAIRAREFSEAVAILGQHHPLGSESLRQLAEIEDRQAACGAAADALERYIELQGIPTTVSCRK